MLAKFNVSGSIETITVRRVTKSSVVSNLILIDEVIFLTVSIRNCVTDKLGTDPMAYGCLK